MDGTGKKRLRVRSEEGRVVILNLFKIKMKKKKKRWMCLIISLKK